MKKFLISGAALLALAACGQKTETAGVPAGGAVVLIDGSSTVYPISEALGEEFQKTSGNRVTVGLSGTGGGFKKFCRGEIDISGASRPIKEEEIKLCQEAGVEFIELPVALDALAVIVNPENKFADCLTVEELKKIWEPSAQGKVSSWKQVRASSSVRALPMSRGKACIRRQSCANQFMGTLPLAKSQGKRAVSARFANHPKMQRPRV